jgi:SAM-dependent methyltransferase
MGMAQEINIFNQDNVTRHHIRAKKTLPQAAFLYDYASKDVLDRVQDMQRPLEKGLHVGARNGVALGELPTRINYRAVTDAAPELLEGIKQPAVVCKDDALPFAPKSFDVITSVLRWHWANDLPGVLLQLNKMLAPEGLLIGNLLGEQTLVELRDVLYQAEMDIKGGASPRVSPAIDIKTLGMLLQRAGFQSPVVDVEKVQVVYPSMPSLLMDLKAMGETSALVKHGGMLRRDILKYAFEKYQELYPDGEGGIVATFEILSLTALATGE